MREIEREGEREKKREFHRMMGESRGTMNEKIDMM